MKCRSCLKFIVLAVLLVPFWGVRAAYTPTAGDLVKGSSSAVYYVTSDGKRMAFPNEAAYFSWYADFSGVKTISDDDLAALPLAGLVTIRPGTKIVKFETAAKIYAVAHGGMLRALTTTDLAQTIFGAGWAGKVAVVPDAFLTSYKFGADITGAGQYWWANERDASPDIAFDLDPLKAPDAVPVAAPVAPEATAQPPATTPAASPPASTGVVTKNVLFILWDPKRPQDAAPDKSVLERVVYGAAPSVADYFDKQSNGKVKIVNAGILGWYSADKPPEHYWSDDSFIHNNDGFKTGAAERTAEAVKKAEPDFDFKKYDANSDGVLSSDELAVIVVIPQYGDPVDEIDNVYSDELKATPIAVDGVTINKVGELYIGTPLGSTPEFGAISHCFAKYIFNLNDISVGAFSLMSNPHTDLNLDPYTRASKGWLAPKVIPKVQEISVQTLPADGSAIRIDRDQPNGPSLGAEYFLIENRARGYYDNSLPDTGIAIWDVNGGSVSLVRLDNTDSPPDDTRALWHLSDNPLASIARELNWSDGARSGVRLLNLGTASPVMSFTLEKKILTLQDLAPIPSPIQ